MGHVPTSPFPVDGQGAHLPRRQYRRSRPAGSHHLANRSDLAGLGESIASWFLTAHGLVIVERNLQVGRGEIDIVARERRRLVAVEVRTVTRSAYPLDAIGDTKRAQVRRLADSIRISRCDAIGIGVFESGVVVHWCPDLF